MAAINTSASPAPVERDNHNSKNLSESIAEKGSQADNDSDGSSELKQDGVKRVEAVTQTWSPAMMWLVFTKCVHRSKMQKTITD